MFSSNLMRRFSTKNISKQQQYLSPTIYALSTAPARAAIGVIRISGPSCGKIFTQLTGSTKLPKHRLATVRKIYDDTISSVGKDQTGRLLLDEPLILYFQSPRSYTGEDLLELHLHGGTAVINKVMETISKFHMANAPVRLAEPGEFSKRAFQNQRFDLTEVEGINTLIHAETEMQRISALSSVKGETNVLFNEWRDRILKNIALLTTVIDFGEDHDIEEINELFQSVGNDVSKLDDEIRKYVSKIKRSQVLLEGIKLTLIGPPNAGKSSLLNILAQEDKAIVSSIAGTTRDAMEVPLDISGYKVIVGDTAGIRRSSDVIENEGIRRAKKKSLTSDINIVLLPADDDKIDPSFLSHASNVISDKKMLSYVIVNKVDLIDDATKQSLPERLSQKLKIPRDRIKLISCTTQCGIEELIQDLTNRFKEITSTEIADPVTISNRAREILINDILYGFSEFRKFKDADDIVMASEALRCSVDGIGKITGEAIGVEEILGVVFSKFCIGK
ncbi:unnamed protein product [Pichia kudriavzevii]